MGATHAETTYNLNKTWIKKGFWTVHPLVQTTNHLWKSIRRHLGEKKKTWFALKFCSLKKKRGVLNKSTQKCISYLWSHAFQPLMPSMVTCKGGPPLSQLAGRLQKSQKRWNDNKVTFCALHLCSKGNTSSTICYGSLWSSDGAGGEEQQKVEEDTLTGRSGEFGQNCCLEQKVTEQSKRKSNIWPVSAGHFILNHNSPSNLWFPCFLGTHVRSLHPLLRKWTE